MSENPWVVSRKDAAIDHAKSNLAEYVRTGNLAHLAFIEGRRPVRFQIADLHYLDYQDVLAVLGFPGLAADRAFRFGVIGIEGVSIADSPLDRVWRPEHERVRDGETIKTITVKDMQAIFKAIAPKHIIDIGQLIVERAEAERPGNGAGGAG